jgi:hypothetical protein
MSSYRPFAAFSLALGLAANAASAQNLLVNPGFDHSLAGWTLPVPADANVFFEPLDAGGACSSGSLLVENLHPTTGQGPGQCVAVVGGAEYDSAVWGHRTDGGSVTFTNVEYYAGAECEGFLLAINGSTDLEGATDHGWNLSRLRTTAPPAAGSARFRVLAPAGSRVSFDEAAFCPRGTCGATLPQELEVPELPDFRFQVLIAGPLDVPGRLEPASSCLPDTACVSGALGGRTEVMLRVIGPRPNGHLWFQAVRFTPFRVVIVARQLSTGIQRTYLLPESAPEERPLNVEDRTAFLPEP